MLAKLLGPATLTPEAHSQAAPNGATIGQFAEPLDVAGATLERALADIAWTTEVWPSGQRAWLDIDGRATRLGAARGPDAPGLTERFDRAACLLREVAAGGAFEALGRATLDVAVIGRGEVRVDPLDIVQLDGTPIAPLPYAIRAVALADALERLREASPTGAIPLFRPSRTPATGAASRALVARQEPLRLVLRDLRAAYGMPGAILRVPCATAGFFDDPWRELLDLG
jgi:hypothetical protein